MHKFYQNVKKNDEDEDDEVQECNTLEITKAARLDNSVFGSAMV